METKLESSKKEVNDLKNKLQRMEGKHKEELVKVTSERDELIKACSKIEHKEAQYKHELKSKENMITKLQDQIKAKLFDTKKMPSSNKENNGSLFNMQASARIIPSNEVKFSKMSSDADMSLMIQKSHEELYKKVQSENHELKDCLKMLQREMFDIVKMKSDIYLKRFKAENFNPDDVQAVTSEEILKHEITKIKEQLFNMNFEE